MLSNFIGFLTCQFIISEFPDTQAGLKGVRSTYRKKIFNYKTNGFLFDIEILNKAKKNNLKIKKFYEIDDSKFYTLSYVYKAISIIKSKIPNPQFFVWSDYTYNLDSFFDKKEFTFIDNKKNKSLNDFNLFRYSKHFIVGPTTFHWWGAWLNTYSNKLCLRPKNINPSNNSDFWPESWIKID